MNINDVCPQEEVTALTTKTQKMSSLQSENAMFKVKLDTLEQERQEELHKMNHLLETNFKIDLDRHQMFVYLFVVCLYFNTSLAKTSWSF